ncbi:MAG: prepilin peptidase [Planctomycetes bacterium]|nr:prepilin peptidase [Planctomycetota bacterium]NBY00791.1 prepilin peptidase [Planctomycetota bacterium]
MAFSLLIWAFFIFITGACVGSFINVCVFRLNSERSVFWPGSHCASCFKPIAWFDNIPILSYLFLWGKCRKCKSSFSSRYMLIEIFSGLMFVSVFLLDVIWNVPKYGIVESQAYQIGVGLIPGNVWLTFISHAILLSFLLTASLTDLDKMEIPLGVTITGTLFGLVFSTFQAWPFPDDIQSTNQLLLLAKDWPVSPQVPQGSMTWPLWYPVFDWLDSRPYLHGFLASLAGIGAGTFLLRAIRFTYGVGRGIEGMGLGDADLMMMVGAFWGWQLVFVAFFLAVIPAFFFGILQLFSKGEQAFPFGPSLAISSVATFYCWKFLASYFQPIFFEFQVLLILAAFSAFSLLLISFIFRLLNNLRSNQVGG